jgi:hypothetical protein
MRLPGIFPVRFPALVQSGAPKKKAEVEYVVRSADGDRTVTRAEFLQAAMEGHDDDAAPKPVRRPKAVNPSTHSGDRE